MSQASFLFTRSLTELSPGNGVTKNLQGYDVEYNYNSYGYRSDEFHKDTEILILGCSQTFGYGINKEDSWGEIFAKNINKSCANLAEPGDGLQGQVYKAFKYFEEIGHPKIIVGCFPIMRLEFPIVPGKLKKIENGKDQLGRSVAYLHGDTFSKMSKSPHDPEAVLPKEFAIFYNFMYLQMLEQYCRSHNITFIWAVWDFDFPILYARERNIKIFNNYVKQDVFNFKNLSKKLNYMSEKDVLECHKEFENEKFFYNAEDWVSDEKMGHWGTHMHLHVAEIFEKTYMDLKND